MQQNVTNGDIIEKLQENWDELIIKIRDEAGITNISYETWLKPLTLGGFNEDVMYVNIPSDNKITQDYINSHFLNFFLVVFSEFLGRKIDILFLLKKDKPVSDIYNNEESRNKNTPDSYETHEQSVNTNLNPKYRFDTFVVGNNNRLAHQASLAVAESPGEAYNPLFLYGGPGLGKTHLMHSIGHFIIENRPSAKVIYVTSEDFTNEVIASIRSGKEEQLIQLREKYRTVDVLMVDDVQFIIGKDRTQEEFFHTFNSLHQSGKQIILSSDRPPREMDTLDERFRSRFNWGLVADIQAPDYETRMAILQKNAENNHVNFDNSVFDYVASNVTTNIRDLEGAFNKLIVDARMHQIPFESFTVADAEKSLMNIISPGRNRQITIPLIVSTVCDYYGIREEELSSRRRTTDVVVPRQVAMYLCRILTDSPLEEIGKQLGKKDHTTVINGVDKIKNNLSTDEKLARDIDQLKKNLGVSSQAGY